VIKYPHIMHVLCPGYITIFKGSEGRLRLPQKFISSPRLGIYALQFTAVAYFSALLDRLDPLDDDGSSGTTSVADGGNTVLARLELVEKSGEDTRTGAAESVAEGDGASQGVNIGVLKTEELGGPNVSVCCRTEESS
jgi:hypothetical protein